MFYYLFGLIADVMRHGAVPLRQAGCNTVVPNCTKATMPHLGKAATGSTHVYTFKAKLATATHTAVRSWPQCFIDALYQPQPGQHPQQERLQHTLLPQQECQQHTQPPLQPMHKWQLSSRLLPR